jgi:hypothetical protein
MTQIKFTLFLASRGGRGDCAAVNRHQPNDTMKTTNSADLPSNQFAAVTAGAIIKCGDSSRFAQQEMLAKAKRYALDHFSRPNGFYHDIGMCFVAVEGSKINWIGAHEVADAENVCFIQVCRAIFPI